MTDSELIELATVFAVAFTEVMDRPRRFYVDKYLFAKTIKLLAKNGNIWAQSWSKNNDQYIVWKLTNVLSMAQHAGLGAWCAPTFNEFEFYGSWRLKDRYGIDLDAVAVVRYYLKQLGEKVIE